MKAPSWMVVSGPRRSEDGKYAVFDVRVRWWHPYVWWLLLRGLVGR